MENLNKRPSKGILRFSEGASRSNSIEKDKIKFDEDNIKETLHPDDKDYGFMKIDEPPTPYSSSPHGRSGENSDDEDDSMGKTDELLERVSRKIKEPPVAIDDVEAILDTGNDAASSSASSFELKRKRHYNEFQAVKLAKKLLEKELADDDDDADVAGSSGLQEQEQSNDQRS